MVVDTQKTLQCRAEETGRRLFFGTTTCVQDSQKMKRPRRPQPLQQPCLQGEVEMVVAQMSYAELTKFG